jgi:hypothetical protein
MEKSRRTAAEDAVSAPFPRPDNFEEAWSQLVRMMAYEQWVEAGRPVDGLLIKDWPFIYRPFFERWPEAFEFYRHNAFAYVSRNIGHMPLGEVVDSMLQRMKVMDPSGYLDFVKVLKQAGVRFQRQRREATSFLKVISQVQSPQDELRGILHGYANLYETDFPIWFLGVLGRGFQTGSLDPEFLGGPESKTAQGALIASVRESLDGTPLCRSFDLSFDRPLRNAVAHNAYEIVEGDSDLDVVDHTSGQRWSADEVWDRAVEAQHLHHAVVLASQLAVANEDKLSVSMEDVGVLSFTWSMMGDGWPLAVVLQLWCFRDLDPRGSWIDAAELELAYAGDKAVSRLTKNATTEGPRRRGEVPREFREAGWAWVVRVPIAPNLTLGLPPVRTLEGDVYEIVGAPDTHLVRFAFSEGASN